MLRHSLNKLPRKMGRTYRGKEDGTGLGHEGHLKRMKQMVGDLFRYERIESTFSRCDEARGYAERLIQIAAKHGDKHKPTMEIADYWLEEKDLIHKLFKVLVPRYSDQKYLRSSYTDVYKLPVQYPGPGKKCAIIELKGNPWPPVIPKVRDTSKLLSNVLLSAARRDYYEEKQVRESKGKQNSGIVRSDKYYINYSNNTESEVKAENLDKQETTVEEDSTSNKKT